MAIELEMELETMTGEISEEVAEGIEREEAENEVTDDVEDGDQEEASIATTATTIVQGLEKLAEVAGPDAIDEMEKNATQDRQSTTPPAPPSFDIDSSALDLLSQISNAELRCKRAEWVVIERKEALKEAKDEFDGCVAELRKIAAQAKNDSQRPLFNVVVGAGATSTTPNATATPIATDVAPDAGTITSDAIQPEEAVIAVDDCNAWKSTSIDELDDLTPATLEALRRGDIATLGELSDLIARCDGGSSDYWPKGIGKKKQQQIIESLLTWKENNGELGTVDTASVPVTLPNWEALSVEEQQTYLESRRQRLTGKTCAELDALYPADHPQHGTFAQGKEDQSNDDLLINCPCSPDTNGDWSFVDAWIAGWLWGDRQLDGSSEDAAG